MQEPGTASFPYFRTTPPAQANAAGLIMQKPAGAPCPNGSRAATSLQWIPNYIGSRVSSPTDPLFSRDIGRITAHVSGLKGCPERIWNR